MPYKDPKKRREYQKVYAAKRWRENIDENKRLAKERRKSERANNPKKYTELKRKAKIRWVTKNPLLAWAAHSNAKHRQSGYAVQITTKDLAMLAEKILVCHYCGAKLNYTPFKGNHLKNSATVDRVNNESILMTENIQIICLSCNRRKQKKSHAQHLELLGKAMETRA